MSGLDIDTRWDGTTCVLALHGEARLETVERFDEVAQDALTRGASAVLLDLSGLEFMDSASAGSLLGLYNEVEQRDGSLVLYGMRPVIAKLLDRAGLAERFLTADDEAGARALL